MAVTAANTTLNSVSFPLSRLGNLRQGYQLKVNNFTCSTSFSNCKIRIAKVSCFVKPVLSDIDQVQRSNPSNDNTSSDSWSEFTRNVSGEWDGFGADFSSEGQPIELPESVVPEAFREWDVKVFDWQTQCPTLAQLEEPTMLYKSIQLLPTVGCEADAATRYNIDERNIGGVDNKVSAFAYQPSGCYVAVWPIGDHDTYRLVELEHCLVNPQDREARVRIIQVVRVDDTKIVLQSIRVFCEQWYGPYRNGDQLGGCAIRDSGFASTAAIKASEVIGAWEGPNAVAKFDGFQANFIQRVRDDKVLRSIRDESNLVLLPRQLWSSLKESEDGETCSEVGWLFNPGCAVTSRSIFSDGVKLKEISIARETAASKDVQ